MVVLNLCNFQLMSHKRKFEEDKSKEDEPALKKHCGGPHMLYTLLCSPFFQQQGVAQFKGKEFYSLRARMPYLPEEEFRRVWIRCDLEHIECHFKIGFCDNRVVVQLIPWPGDALLADWLPNLIPSAGVVGIIRAYSRHFEMTRESLDDQLNRVMTTCLGAPDNPGGFVFTAAVATTDRRDGVLPIIKFVVMMTEMFAAMCHMHRVASLPEPLLPL